MSVRGPNGKMVEFPMESEVDSNKITVGLGVQAGQVAK